MVRGREGVSRGDLTPSQWGKLTTLVRVKLQGIGRAPGEALPSIREAG